MEQRARAEEELRLSEERFRRIFESAAVGLVQIDSTGKFVNANPKFCQITGYPIGELLQRTFFDLTLPQEREDEIALFHKALSGELPVYQSETRLQRKDEKAIWARTTTSLLRNARGSPDLCIVIVEDVTAQKETAMALRENQRTFQEIADNSPAMIFVKDTCGRYLFSNREFQTITHMPSRSVIGKTDQELFPPTQASMFQANDFKVLESGSALEFEETAMHDDGPHVSIVHKFPLRNSSGNVYAIGGIATDITQRKQVEEDLRKAQQGYANLVSSIDGIVWESDAATLRFTFVSQKAERFLLYPIEQWLTEPDFWKNHLHPEDREWAVEFCSRSVREKKDHDFEYRMLTADGRTVWLRDIVSVIIEPDGTVK
jgi:PAS domain S-box-containing protein